MSHRLRAVLGAAVLVTLAVAAGCGTPGPSATEIQDEETATTDGSLGTQTTDENDAGAEPVNPGVGTTSTGTESHTPAGTVTPGAGDETAATTDEPGDETATADGSDEETPESGGE